MTLRSRTPSLVLVTLGALCSAPVLMAGCAEDPIIIGPPLQSPDASLPNAMDPMGGAGGSPMPMDDPPQPDPGGAGGSGGASEEGSMPMPDPALFQSSVVGLLYSTCSGPACHQAAVPNPNDALYQLVTGGPDGLSEAQQQLNFEESLAFVDFDDPAQSQLLVHHPPEFPAYLIPGSATYNRILEWIEDALLPPEMQGAGGEGGAAGAGGMGGDGGTGGGEAVPCQGIPPPGDPAGRSNGYRDAFEMPDADGVTISDLLVQSCGEMGACHGTQAAAGGYWLLGDLDDPCAIQWNYLVSQWFIDAIEPDASLLLTKPRERDHGGRVVFRGRDDPRHVRLLLWIENEFAAR